MAGHGGGEEGVQEAQRSTRGRGAATIFFKEITVPEEERIRESS